MADLNLTGLSPHQAIALGDGAMVAKQYRLAATIYAAALGDAGDMRSRLLNRLGLAKSSNGDTPELFRLVLGLENLSRNIFVGEGLATWRKTLPFFDDQRFMDLAAKHAALLPLPNWHWNLQTVLWAVQTARGVDGDLVELGVFKGHTTLFVAEYVEFAAWPKRWRLYDTFEGVPADQVDPGWEAINKTLYQGTFTHEEVSARFAHIPNIEVTKGRVPEVLSDAPERISFLHMDLNNATAEVAALDVLFDRISPGGIVVFDDFGWANCQAQRAAEVAWFEQRGLSILSLPTGQGVFVKGLAPR